MLIVALEPDPSGPTTYYILIFTIHNLTSQHYYENIASVALLYKEIFLVYMLKTRRLVCLYRLWLRHEQHDHLSSSYVVLEKIKRFSLISLDLLLGKFLDPAVGSSRQIC
jgi:hypothetical protein